MEESGESRRGRLGKGVILIRRGTVRRLCPHPLLHYCLYVPLDCASGSVSGAKPHVTFQLRGKKERGNDVRPTCQRQQANCGDFSVSICCFITRPRRHLQPSTLVASFNFNPRRHFISLQLQSSLPTSSLVATNFNPCRLSISKPVIVLFPPLLLDDACSVLDAVAAR
jgi:hypothetical protein